MEIAKAKLPLAGTKVQRILLEETPGGGPTQAGVMNIYEGQSNHLELVIEEEMHYDLAHDRIIMVLGGEPELIVHEGGQDQTIELEEGDIVLIERKKSHKVRSPNGDACVLLSVYSPPYDPTTNHPGRYGLRQQ